ncbi:MAG: hypothetical protein AB7S50_03190 [Bacteroidales bacterium]
MKYLFFIILIFITSLNVNAQEQRKPRSKKVHDDKTRYENEVFNKEFDKDFESQNKQLLYDRIPEQLPDWFFEPILVDPVRVVGISDPGMEKADAINQAVMRAKAIYALVNYSVVSNIADDYTNLRESGNKGIYETKFQDFTLSKALIFYKNDEVTIVDTFFTKYNEAIVYIKLKACSDPNYDTLEVKGEHMQVYTERGDRSEKIEFYNIFVKDSKRVKDTNATILQYNFRKLNRNYDIASLYGNRMIELPDRSFNYVSKTDFSKDSTDTDLQANTLALGLWNGYMCGILSNISNLSKQLSSHIKNSNDFYTLKSEGLIRTVAKSKARYEINKFKLIKNEIYIDLYGEIRR